MIKVTRVSYQIGNKGAVVSRPVINQKDVDTNRIEFAVFDGTLPYELETTGLGVTFYFVNRDGQYMGVTADSIIDNKAYVDVPDEIIVLVGQIDIEVEITDGSRVLNVTGFALSIEPSKRAEQTVFTPPEGYQIAWQDILGKPTALPPTAHTHDVADLLNLHEWLEGGLGIVNVKDYGAVGDGVTDDSQAILDAIDALPAQGGTLYFPVGTYIHGDGIADPINGTGNSYEPHPTDPARPYVLGSTPVDIGRDIRLRFINKTGLTIIGYGATIRSHPNNGECRNNSLFYFEKVKKLRVLGINIDGNKNNRQPQFSDYSDGSGSSSRGSFSIAGADDVILSDVRSDNSMMDGYYIGGFEDEGPATNVRVINCHANNCYRNGLTFSNTLGAFLQGGSYTNTGQTYGTAPMVGIDIEADWSTTFNDDCIIYGAYFTGNVIAGGAFSFGARNCKFVSCTFDNESSSVGYTFDANRLGHNYIQNCHLINCSLTTEPNSVTIEGNTVELRPVVGAGQSYEGLFFELQGSDITPTSFVIMKNNLFKVDLTNVSPSATSVRAGYMNFRSRKNFVFEGNTVVNMYSAGSNTQSCFIYGWYDDTFGEQVIKNNTFLFNHAPLLATCLTNVFIDIPTSKFANFAEGNLIKGYPVGASQRGGLHRFSTLQTGSQQEYNMMVERNQYYSYDPSLMSTDNPALNCHVTLEFNYLDEKVVLEGTVGQFNFSSLKHYVEGKPSLEVPTWLTIWVSGGTIYFVSTAYYVNMTAKVKYSGGGASYYMSRETHPIRDIESTVVSGMTAKAYELHALSASSVATIPTALLKSTGQVIFLTGVNKPVWWNGGTGDWRDATGAIVT